VGEKPKSAQSCATSNNGVKSSIHPYKQSNFVSKQKHENNKMLEIMAILDTI